MYLQAFFIFAGFYLNQFVGRAGWLGLESLSARFGKLAGPSGWHDGRDVGFGRGSNAWRQLGIEVDTGDWAAAAVSESGGDVAGTRRCLWMGEQVARRAAPGLGETAQRADLIGTSWRDRTPQHLPTIRDNILDQLKVVHIFVIYHPIFQCRISSAR
jgi:hypothetical protein